MIKGYAAHIIVLNGEVYKSAIVMLDESDNFMEIKKLNRETPFTRFFDGTLVVAPSGMTTGPDYVEKLNLINEFPNIEKGTKVNILQINPYDLHNMKALSSSRVFSLK